MSAGITERVHALYVDFVKEFPDAAAVQTNNDSALQAFNFEMYEVCGSALIIRLFFPAGCQISAYDDVA